MKTSLETPSFRRPGHPPDLEARITYLATEQGGRRLPIFSGYRPNHDFGLPEELNDGMHEYPDRSSVLPGEDARALLWLLVPERNIGRLYVGMKFTVQEGSRIVGHGEVLAIFNPILQQGV